MSITRTDQELAGTTPRCQRESQIGSLRVRSGHRDRSMHPLYTRKQAREPIVMANPRRAACVAAKVTTGRRPHRLHLPMQGEEKHTTWLDYYFTWRTRQDAYYGDPEGPPEHAGTSTWDPDRERGDRRTITSHIFAHAGALWGTHDLPLTLLCLGLPQGSLPVIDNPPAVNQPCLQALVSYEITTMFRSVEPAGPGRINQNQNWNRRLRDAVVVPPSRRRPQPTTHASESSDGDGAFVVGDHRSAHDEAISSVCAMHGMLTSRTSKNARSV